MAIKKKGLIMYASVTGNTEKWQRPSARPLRTAAGPTTW